MKKTPSQDDRVTLQYYRASQVVGEYDELRFASRGGRLLRSLQQEALFKALPPGLPGFQSVLDVGCGTGRVLEALERRGPRLVGLDASPLMIAAAHRKVKEATYVLGDVRALPFETDSFDLALSVWVVNHLNRYDQAIGEMCRVARRVVIAVPNSSSLLKLTRLFKRLGGPRLLRRESAMGLSPAAASPFSRNFQLRELLDVFVDKNFAVTYVGRALLLPVIPDLLAFCYRPLERWAGPLRKRFGTFMVVSAQKKLAS